MEKCNAIYSYTASDKYKYREFSWIFYTTEALNILFHIENWWTRFSITIPSSRPKAKMKFWGTKDELSRLNVSIMISKIQQKVYY